MGDRAGAVNLFEEAARRGDKGDLYYQLMSSAAMLDWGYAPAWGEVGRLNAEQGAWVGAVAAYRRAVASGELDRTVRAKALISIGHLLHRLGRLEEAGAAIDEGLELDGSLALGYLNHAMVVSEDGDLAAALSAAQHAYALDQQSPGIEVGLAFSLMFCGYWAEGLRHFESRFRYKLQSFLSYPFPQWQGEPDVDLFLVSDQGLGDAIAFGRFVGLAVERCRHVSLAVPPELRRLFKPFEGEKLTIIPLPCAFPSAQYWSTLMSLPTALGLSDAEIVGAQPLPIPHFEAPAKWKSADAKVHIGVCWSVSKDSDTYRWRSLPFDLLLDLCQIPGVALYSLQMDAAFDDLHRAGAAALVKDMRSYIRDMGDTAAIVRELDFCISPDTALAHLCAALGKEHWCLYSYHGRSFYYGHIGQRPLWMDGRHVFKQGPDGDWRPVMKRVVEYLRERMTILLEMAA